MSARSKRLVALALSTHEEQNAILPSASTLPESPQYSEMESLAFNNDYYELVPVPYNLQTSVFDFISSECEEVPKVLSEPELTEASNISESSEIGQISNLSGAQDYSDNVIIFGLDEPIICHAPAEGIEIYNLKESNSSLDADFHQLNPIISKPSFVKLVDYDSSSSEFDQDITTCNKSPRRNSSEYSFDENNNKSDSCSSTDTIENTMGNSCLKKPKRPCKKALRKSLNKFGANKCVRKNPCSDNCPNQCISKFPDIAREHVFEFYWGLGTLQRQRDYLLSCIKDVQIKRRKQEAQESRRQCSYKYFIRWNDVEHEVCQQFLLKTLDISQMTLRYTKKNSTSATLSKIDQRGKHVPHNKTGNNQKLNVFDFIKMLPAVPSHYCRNKTSRRYLPTEFRNVSYLYELFRKNQSEKGTPKNDIVSLQVFRKIFKSEFNIGFHFPKKDKCKLCEVRKDQDFEETEETKQIFEKHSENKDLCKDSFLADQKKNLSEPGFLCVSFDLQKVLNTPHGDNLLLYYSRKYAFYNLSIYESGTQNGFCYLWGECDGGRGSNEICTIIHKYLEEVDRRQTIQHLSLNCDSCYGQNKNKAMFVMISNFLKDSINIRSISVRYLLPGHTYMPVDSVHATIERFIKKRIVWAPSEWCTLIANSRTKPKPFEIIKMEFTEFLGWKKISDELLKPNKFKCNEGNPIKISEIKCIKFEKGNTNVEIDYSYNGQHCTHFKMDLKGKKPKRLFSQKLCISTAKKKDLIDLCDKNIIPLRFQHEYRLLKTSATPDRLAESDEEDEDDEES